MISTVIEDEKKLIVLPCQLSDTGSQRCWLGPVLMSTCNLRLNDVVAIRINSHRSYLCRAWPRIDGDGNCYIQFDGTVGAESDGVLPQRHVVSQPLVIPKSAVESVTCSALSSVTVSIIINKLEDVLKYKRDCMGLLESHIGFLLRGLTVAKSHTVLCTSLGLGTVFDWDRVIVHEMSTKQQTFAGVVNDNTKIIVKEFCCKEKFEQKFCMPTQLGGLDREIQMLKDIILRSQTSALEDPDSCISVNCVRGVLLTGPPGCGKKSLLRHVATKCDAFMVHVDASLHGARPGDSERNLRAAFRRAADISSNELCILFLNELDAICPRRRSASSEGDSLSTRMLAELLYLMDDLHDNQAKFIVVSTSSKPTDIDPSLRRFGRFEKEFFIGIPGELQRHEILKVLMPHKAIADDVNLSALSSATAGYTGADLLSLLRVAVVIALDHTPEVDSQPLDLQVTMKDFSTALHLVRPSIQGASDMFITNSKPISWDDIGGLADVKQQLIQAIEWPRKFPNLCRTFGLRPPRGILLYGPPGCAKTSLARAAAASCNITFLAVSSAQLYSPFFGDAEKQIDELFRQARACAPSLLFIDEIDSVIGSRSDADFSSAGGSSVQQRVLSALLTQMDGIGLNSGDVERHRKSSPSETEDSDSTDDAAVLVMAATNRLDMVDSALLRPGRMDHIIFIPLPDYDARSEIMKVYTRTKPIEHVDLDELTHITDGFTGADLENLCNEASLYAIHTDGPDCSHVTAKHFDAILRELKPSVSETQLSEYARTHQHKSLHS